MIDDIVEMILAEAKVRDSNNLFFSLFAVFEEIFNRIFPMIFISRIAERRKKDNENKA